MKLLIEKQQINNIIINPEDNKKVADLLTNIIINFKRKAAMRRDNCGIINWELYEHLISNGIDKDKIKIVRGEFKTDNLKLIDKRDLTPSERKHYRNVYSDIFTNEMIIQFIEDGNAGFSIEEFYYLPHQWLEYDNLILDAASDMFNKGMEGKITKHNYIENR
jgi:hypothetical protein